MHTLRDVGRGEFLKTFAKIEEAAVNLPTTHLTVPRCDSVRADVAPKQNFICPVTGSTSRIVLNLFVVEEIDKKFSTHRAMLPHTGLGIGCRNSAFYRITDRAKEYRISRARKKARRRKPDARLKRGRKEMQSLLSPPLGDGSRRAKYGK